VKRKAKGMSKRLIKVSPFQPYLVEVWDIGLNSLIFSGLDGSMPLTKVRVKRKAEGMSKRLIKVSPFQPYLVEVWDVQGRTPFEELDALTKNRISHGTRGKSPTAWWIHPFVYPV
jgi:hypothetical protein